MGPPRNRQQFLSNKQGAAAGGDSATNSSASSILAEARKLKQQAERKPEGTARSAVLKRCAQLLNDALALPLSFSDQEEAWFDLGEVLLLSSASVLAGVSTLTGTPFKPNVMKPRALQIQLQASLDAATLSRQSHEMFERVCSREGRGELKEEAAVNSGNALCQCAELALEIPSEMGGGAAIATELYRQAFDRYSAALTASADDVELLTNVGDCCIQRAELAASSSELNSSGLPSGWDLAKEYYERALGAYALACANADARIGDDLAGLLQNWGVGLFSVAQRSPDPEEAMKFVRTAQEKLRSAMKFRPTDSSLCLALGEGLLGVADHFANNPHLQQQVLEYLKVAVEDGFGEVLKIDSRNVSALLGLGDAHLAAAKLLASSGGETNARKHLEESVKSYALAVRLLKEDSGGEVNLKFDEQCDVLYNLACAAALAGSEPEVHGALVQLARVDALVVNDVLEDRDLVSIRSQDWFNSLLQGIQSTSTS
ncbi:unnamed protein product [Calypogeia fissa]